MKKQLEGYGAWGMVMRVESERMKRIFEFR